MIEIHIMDGLQVPVLVCDLCGELITDAAKEAIVNRLASAGDMVEYENQRRKALYFTS